MAPVPSRPVNSSDVHVLQQRGPPPIPFKGIALNPASNTRDLFVTISLRTNPDDVPYAILVIRLRPVRVLRLERVR